MVRKVITDKVTIKEHLREYSSNNVATVENSIEDPKCVKVKNKKHAQVSIDSIRPKRLEKNKQLGA